MNVEVARKSLSIKRRCDVVGSQKLLTALCNISCASGPHLILQVLRVSPSPSSQFLPTHFSTPVTCLEAGDFKAGTERPARTWVLVDEKDNSHLGISVWWVRVTASILHIRPLFLDITTKRAAGIGPSVAVFPFCSDFKEQTCSHGTKKQYLDQFPAPFPCVSTACGSHTRFLSAGRVELTGSKSLVWHAHKR